LGGDLVAPDEHDLFNLGLYPVADLMNIITPAHKEIAEELITFLQPPCCGRGQTYGGSRIID
jgi:hypothetical protein